MPPAPHHAARGSVAASGQRLVHAAQSQWHDVEQPGRPARRRWRCRGRLCGRSRLCGRNLRGHLGRLWREARRAKEAWAAAKRTDGPTRLIRGRRGAGARASASRRLRLSPLRLQPLAPQRRVQPALNLFDLEAAGAVAVEEFPHGQDDRPHLVGPALLVVGHQLRADGCAVHTRHTHTHTHHNRAHPIPNALRARPPPATALTPLCTAARAHLDCLQQLALA
eukprot:4464635-Prymnesium_polylepis.1